MWRAIFPAVFACVQILAAQSPVVIVPASEQQEDEEVEIVIRRRRKPVAVPPPVPAPTPAPAPAPVVSAPVAPPPPPVVATPAVEPPQPPPLEPPVEDAAEPRRLVRYFCKLWKDEDYERMWWAMVPAYRRETTLEKFAKLFADDRERNGGIVDENIVTDDVERADGTVLVHVDVRYRFKRVGVRRLKAVLEKKKNMYRLRASGLIPPDLDDL